MSLPMGKVRNVVNLDPENLPISKDALLLMTKATESFVADLGGVVAQIAAKTRKQKTLQVADLVFAAQNIDKFHFIKDSKLPALRPAGSTQNKPKPASAQEE